MSLVGTCGYVVDVLAPNSFSLVLVASDVVENPHRLSANSALAPLFLFWNSHFVVSILSFVRRV